MLLQLSHWLRANLKERHEEEQEGNSDAVSPSLQTMFDQRRLPVGRSSQEKTKKERRENDRRPKLFSSNQVIPMEE